MEGRREAEQAEAQRMRVSEAGTDMIQVDDDVQDEPDIGTYIHILMMMAWHKL